MGGSLLRLTLLWWILVVSDKLSAQPDGFLSIDCGGTSPYTDTTWTNITWDNDDIATGSKEVLDPKNNYDNFNWEAVRTAQSFPQRKKNCYVLTVEKERYLIRALFYFANLKFLPPGASYRFNVSVDANLWRTILITNSTAEGLAFEESIVTALGTTISICLIDIGEGTPFISSLELRPLKTLYAEMAGDNFLVLLHRMDCSAYEKPPIRYPQDPFDRFWRRHDMYSPEFNTQSKYSFSNISTNATPVAAYVEYPPVLVMETAWSETDIQFKMIPSASEQSTKLDTTTFLSMFYIWDFEETIAGSRNYSIYLDDEKLFDVKAGDNRLFWKNHTRKDKADFINSVWRINTTSTNPALLNAVEFYATYPRASLTFNPDVIAVLDLQELYLVTDTYPAWTGDPCQPVPWDWLQCNSTEDPPRVTHVNLSRVFSQFNDSALTLPPTFKNLTALTYLSLDNNNLTGEIPDLGFLTKLQVLHLEGNRLSGSIPGFLGKLPNLVELYLQRNNLSGWVPDDLKKPGLKFLAGCNPLLQGLTSTTDQCNVMSYEDRDALSQTELYILIFVLGGALSAGLGLFLAYICYRRKKEQDRSSASVSTLKAHKNQARCFKLDEVKSATNNFDSDRLIGEGGFGRVYYGRLDDGSEVAVKVGSESSHQGPDEFHNEVNLLSRVHHKNLVSLVGYCQDDFQKVLIYPFMPGKTLRDHLWGSATLLSWRQRLEIALDAARGLCYLHKDCSPMIVHRDVKSNNILLDQQLRAKVADFGISKSAEGNMSGFQTTTRVIGTTGYLDPEYTATRRLTPKSDVYSFGVVLLEIISGRPPINSLGPIDRAHWHLIDWVQQLVYTGNISAMVDPALGESYNREAMWKVAELAIQSVQPTSSKRISMEEVVTGLTEALALELEISSPRQEHRQLDNQFSMSNETRSYETTSDETSLTHDHWQQELEYNHTFVLEFPPGLR